MTQPTDIDIRPPAGAESDMWTGTGTREVFATVGSVPVSPDPLKCPVVTVVAEQRHDGSVGCIDVMLDVAMGRSDTGLAITQARELASLLTQAADLAEQWIGTVAEDQR